jgi:hypothetical protein
MYVVTGDDNFDGGSGNVYQLNSIMLKKSNILIISLMQL